MGRFYVNINKRHNSSGGGNEAHKGRKNKSDKIACQNRDMLGLSKN